MHTYAILSKHSAVVLAIAASLTLGGPLQAQDISTDRCELNKNAGEVIFLTSFAYAASHGILDVVAAEKLGLFDDLCLDLTIEPGGTNTQLVSAGTAQLAGIGGASDTMVAVANGAEIVGIATYGNTGAIEVITMADSGIEELKDFEGKIVGYKGAVAPQFSAMLIDNGVDPEKITWVSVGYDPIILAEGQVQGLGAYKSNEPRRLEALGYDVSEWDPNNFGIDSTFNTQIANITFATEHPTAVEDFLRASFKAYEWILENDANLDQALAWAAELSTAGYDVPSSKMRFQTEVDLIADTQPDGWGFGMQSVEQWQPEADMLVRFGLVETVPDVATSMSPDFISAIYDDAGDLIWPGH